MKVHIIGGGTLHPTAIKAVKECGHQVVDTLDGSDVAIAPLLTYIIPYSELSKPRYGTLIFHPSPLPYGRGASAIRWAYRRGEPITAATWFWANDGKVDSGDICEMEILKTIPTMRPRVFYELHVVPAMDRTLKRCLNAISRGYIRRVPQLEEHSSFDYKL